MRSPSPDEMVHVAAQHVCNRAREIGDKAAPVGFPEPALPGLLVIGEDFLGAGLEPHAFLDRDAQLEIDLALTQVGRDRDDAADHHRCDAACQTVDPGDTGPHGDFGGEHTGQTARFRDGGQQRDGHEQRERLNPWQLATCRPQPDGNAINEQRNADRRPHQQHAHCCRVLPAFLVGRSEARDKQQRGGEQRKGRRNDRPDRPVRDGKA